MGQSPALKRQALYWPIPVPTLSSTSTTTATVPAGRARSILASTSTTTPTMPAKRGQPRTRRGTFESPSQLRLHGKYYNTTLICLELIVSPPEATAQPIGDVIRK